MKYFKVLLVISFLSLVYLLGLGLISYFEIDQVFIGAIVELMTIPIILAVVVLFGYGLINTFLSPRYQKQFLGINLINFISISWMVIMTYY